MLRPGDQPLPDKIVINIQVRIGSVVHGHKRHADRLEWNRGTDAQRAIMIDDVTRRLVHEIRQRDNAVEET
jgi:hypothetical protein